MRNVHLTLASSDPRVVAARVGNIRWAYLGRDFARTRQWEEVLPGTRISYAGRFQQLARAWRSRYLDWITKESLAHSGELEWWTSAIADKNTLLDSLYHAICYLGIAMELLRDGDEPLLLIAERERVLSAIEAQRLSGVRLQRVAVPFARKETARLGARFAYVWTRWALRSLRELRDARVTRRETPQTVATDDGRPRVVIHTCIDESYFGADGIPRDRYFSGLPNILRELGYHVRTQPWLFNIRRSRRDAFRWLRARGAEYVIPEDDYELRDYLWSAGVVMKQLFSGRGLTTFEGLDVRPLVRAARLEQAGNEATAHFVRYHRLVEKWVARGERVDVFIDMFENMMTEKPQVLALRRYMPATLTTGFQHFMAPPPLQLFMRTTPAEAAVAPHPDMIVCTSAYALGEMERAGFPPHKLRVGASLRYAYLPDLPLRRERGRDRIVLVLLSMEESASLELMVKLIEAFPRAEGIEFRIKPHPMVTPSFMGGLLDRLPEGMIRVGGDIGPQLAAASCAVVTASTTALELALSAVPLVVAGRESDFDQNVLEDHPEFAPPVLTAADLRKAVLAQLDISPDEFDRLRRWAVRMRREAYSPLTPDTARVFVERSVVDSQKLEAS